MRAWLLVLAACTSEKPVVQGTPLDVSFCEGTPGSPACPYMPIDLGLAQAPGSTVEMTVLAGGQRQEVTAIVVMAGSSGLYAENPRFTDCPPHPMSAPRCGRPSTSLRARP